jgi:hypothetical protein
MYAATAVLNAALSDWQKVVGEFVGILVLGELVVGEFVGESVGFDEGLAVGELVGFDEGLAVGESVGFDEGLAVGESVVGFDEGALELDGSAEGMLEGMVDG